MIIVLTRIIKVIQIYSWKIMITLTMSFFQVDIQREYDLVQLIGEGWFSRVYLAERRSTREEVAIITIVKILIKKTENQNQQIKMAIMIIHTFFQTNLRWF